MALVLSTTALWLLLKFAVPTWLIYVIAHGIYNRHFHKLRHFPGPYWASITPLWYWKTIIFCKATDVQYPLHEKYGDVVRISPNHLAIGNASAIETVFMPKSGSSPWRKGEFYDSFDPHVPGARTDGFSERHEARHAERRRIIAGLYTQGSVLQYEPCVDRLIELFYQRMEMFTESGETVDMSVWLKRYTFDVVGEIFYGRKGGFGMIRDDVDYNNWCYLMDVMPSVGAATTYFPYGLRTLYLISRLFWKEGRDVLKGFTNLVTQAKQSVYDRWELMQSGQDYPKHDMLTNMLEIVRERGDKVGWSVGDVHTEVWAVIWAGSDTTAIALTSIFYHLHKHPNKLQILLAEIDDAFSHGRLTYPIRFNDARKLPYLHAVIMESMRIHSSLGTGLPREVPAEGAEIAGRFVPGGCEVIMNSCAVHFDPRAFGQDSKQWVPERWLDGEERTVKMERSMLQFGQGPRVCIGRHITNIEMYKLLPTILRDFDFDLLVDEWQVRRSWFHNPSNVMCRVKKRRTGAERPKLVLDQMS